MREKQKQKHRKKQGEKQKQKRGRKKDQAQTVSGKPHGQRGRKPIADAVTEPERAGTNRVTAANKSHPIARPSLTAAQAEFRVQADGAQEPQFILSPFAEAVHADLSTRNAGEVNYESVDDAGPAGGLVANPDDPVMGQAGATGDPGLDSTPLTGDADATWIAARIARFYRQKTSVMLEYVAGQRPRMMELDPAAFVDQVITEWAAEFRGHEMPVVQAEERAFWYALFLLEELHMPGCPLRGEDPYVDHMWESLEKASGCVRQGRPLPTGLYAERPGEWAHDLEEMDDFADDADYDFDQHEVFLDASGADIPQEPDKPGYYHIVLRLD